MEDRDLNVAHMIEAKKVVKTYWVRSALFFCLGTAGLPYRGISVCAGLTKSGHMCVGEKVTHLM